MIAIQWDKIMLWLYYNLFTLPKLLGPGVNLPDSYSLQSRQPTRTMAWMLPSIRTTFSWLSWKAASGAPNCFLSFKYLASDRWGFLDKGNQWQIVRQWKFNTIKLNKLKIDVVMWYTPMAHVKNSHSYAYWLPCYHNARHGKDLFQKSEAEPNKNLQPTKHEVEQSRS